MVAATARVSSHLPEKISRCFHPCQWVAAKVRRIAERCFGFLLRTVIFQLGEYKRPLSYFLLRAYQRVLGDHRETKPVDRDRLERSKSLLLEFGGIESVAIPQDKGGIVRCMTFQADDFLKKIDQLGGQKVPIALREGEGEEQHRFAILPKPGATAAQFQELCQKLKKYYLPEISVDTENGKKVGILLPESPLIAPNQKPPMVIRFHSPGRSMVMDRKFIGLHLGAGYDICISDPRGTIDSEGTPSEGGYYLDAEAVLERVLSLGYPPHRIYISGYCAGAAVGAYLKKKYHEQGVHFIAENPFSSLLDTMTEFHCLGRWFASYALPALQDPAIGVNQDGFDNVAKLQHLVPSTTAKCLVIHTDTDRTMPKDSVQKIRQVIEHAGPYFEIQRRAQDRKANGHMQPPIEDPVVWHRYVEVVV